jgi:hypothetical protein
LNKVVPDGSTKEYILTMHYLKSKRRFDEVGGSFEEKRRLAWCHVIKFVLGWRRGLKEHPSLTLPLKREGEGINKNTSRGWCF